MKFKAITLLAALLLSFAASAQSPKITVSIPNSDLKFDMILVKKGAFVMGGDPDSPLAPDSTSNRLPAHHVSISRDFYIASTVVTQALWQTLMGTSLTDMQALSPLGEQFGTWMGSGDDYPMYYVNWNDAQEFIAKLNSLHLVKGYTFRLPTEAEWEYAARGGKLTKDHIFAGSDNSADVAWHAPLEQDEESLRSIRMHPVAQKLPNELGLYDMSGNVWEWCSDWYDAQYYSSSPSDDPQGPDSGVNRSVRGGCFLSGAESSIITHRDGTPFALRIPLNGFRLVMSKNK